MKKLLLICLFLSCTMTVCIADYRQYYKFNDDLSIQFIPVSANVLDKEEKDEYKTILKNENYMKKKSYHKADKLIPDFIPNIARFINVYSDKKDYSRALDYVQQLSELDKDNLFPNASKRFKTGILYYQNGNYELSNNYLIPSSNPEAIFTIAQNYYYLHDLKNSEIYANKIKNSDKEYLNAQELLFAVYKAKNNPQKAYQCTKNLIKADPGNPHNYVNLASVTTNRDEKLINLYRARQIYYSQDLTTMAAGISNLIAPIEQSKIDDAYAKITSYCKKPDWEKIKKKNEGMLKNDTIYWDKRQNDFFTTANDCIKRYSGANLAACFKDLNDTQTALDSELAAEQARILEAQQREMQIRQLVRQNLLLEERNMMQWSRYNTYPPGYYRYPYWW